MVSSKDQMSDDIREQILQAAKQRFQQFGFNKTTMAEIAKDCGMSAANLYRYYENKLGIGAALASSCLEAGLKQFQTIIDQHEKSATIRLRELVLGVLHHTHSQWQETPHLNETVVAICNEKMDLCDQYQFRQQALIVTLLKQGIQAGEFEVTDPEVSAEAIHTAIILFDVPMLMPLFPLTALERKVHGLVDLLLLGLKHR